MGKSKPRVAQLVEQHSDQVCVGGSSPSLRTIRTTRPFVVDFMVKDIKLGSGSSVLESSAGEGHLVDRLLELNPTLHIDCIELNQTRKQILNTKGYSIVGADFLLFKSCLLYDFVIAAPNFKDGVDLDHVQKMVTHVKPGGQVISLLSHNWLSGETPKEKDFRAWLTKQNYSLRMLPDMYFVENYTSVPTLVITLNV